MTSYFPNLLVPPSVFSVSELTGYLQSLIDQNEQLMQVWVNGEVSSAYRHRSGLFFTLQDPDAEATVQCVTWNAYLDKLAFLPEAGEQAIVLGRMRLYAQRGQYQLVVWQVLPAGEGLRSLRYQQLRHRLESEGLFAPERKRPLPHHPLVIGVVTSPQAAAWGDIQRTLKSRYPGLRVLFSPSMVQGDQAPEEIVAAIARVEADARAEVLIVARGGGAAEDLACFNDERVVRAIAQCRIPVISGIGHQRDETLADLASDYCAHTPTAAASHAVPKLEELRHLHRDRQHHLHHALSQRLLSAQTAIIRQRQRLQRMQLDRVLQRETTQLSAYKHQLQQAALYKLQIQQNHQQALTQKLAALDPLGVLQRGYAIARTPEGKIIRSTKDLKPNQTLMLQLGKGTVRVSVTDLPEN